MKYINKANGIVFNYLKYRIFAIIIFILFFTLYLFILPATYTGGRIGIVSLQFITPTLAIFAFLFAFLFSLILPFSVYAFRKKKTSENSSTISSVFGSIIPPLLCCSPLLPTLAAMIAGFFPFIFGVSGFIQGFIATYEIYIFIATVLILIYSVIQNAKQVVLAENGVCNI